MIQAAFTSGQVSALKTRQQIWTEEQIVLVGASALNCFMEMRWRQTYDLDLFCFDQPLYNRSDIKGHDRHYLSLLAPECYRPAGIWFCFRLFPFRYSQNYRTVSEQN